ncbi:MAG: biopolymer transporter ExbD [Deltaproteobacteria bacterium]|nr:biopolymer transporter ExbD [Deltaproteobacteria bacterium]
MIKQLKADRKLPTGETLNIVSIIDCFTVLVIYLLTTASFISTGALETKLGAATTSNSNQQPVIIALELQKSHSVRVMVDGSSLQTAVIPAKSNGNYDFENASAAIASARAVNPSVQNVVLLAENEILYDDMVRAVREIRKQCPVVLAAGDGI